ncbi:MAG TPA: TetR family transcriptional regulator [Acidothermaceae bacterium]|jgi:AcrR family transcriptional regulator
MPRDSAATKARILKAATAEFAERGLAGARVDRVAASAGANKQLIYAYFGSKEGLFDATLEANLETLLDGVPFDAADLPGYARRLFDFNVEHPELARLARWHSLERPGVFMQLPVTGASLGRKIAKLKAAQQKGSIDDTLPPAQLLLMLLAIIHADNADRETVAHAVQQLISSRAL